MKNALTIFVVGVYSFVGYSQETVKNRLDENSPRPTTLSQETRVQGKTSEHNSGPVTISKRAGEAQKVHDNDYYLAEIAKIDQQLIAIEQKSEYINSNPEEKAIAQSNGWFEDMAEIKTQLKAKKNKYQGLLKK